MGALMLAVVGCQGPLPMTTGLGAAVNPEALPTTTAEGRAVPRGSKGTVYYFAGPECPMARAYAPDVARLVETDRARGIEWVMAFPEEDITVEMATKFSRDYSLPLPLIVAGSTELCCELGVKSFPSVVVIDARDRLVYRGRIDNRYRALGTTFGPPSERDLQAVTDALAGGNAIAPRETIAIGCVLAPCPTDP